MGKDPEGLDLLKVRMEARQKALDTTKVVKSKRLNSRSRQTYHGWHTGRHTNYQNKI